ncbi:hypothetical protein DENSPDRAFT_884915 [Dentipellis sp. KUC8613]|nr:hypothetical protein DENSPDRAFT_884915 [Dentipellis sp. KUC8613]
MSRDLFQPDILSKDVTEENAFETRINFICADEGAKAASDLRFQEHRLLFVHLLVRALHYGHPTSGISFRPGIPLELVSLILKYAGCALLSKSRSIVAVQFLGCNEERLSGCDATVVVRLPPLDAVGLRRIAHIKLVTLSRDQGWQNDPNSRNYSWFDVGVLQGSQPGGDLRKTNGQPALWMSHLNTIVGGSGFSRHEGRIFAHDHPLWNAAAVGDVIVGRARARFGSQRNATASAAFFVWEYFDPLASVVV